MDSSAPQTSSNDSRYGGTRDENTKKIFYILSYYKKHTYLVLWCRCGISIREKDVSYIPHVIPASTLLVSVLAAAEEADVATKPH